MISVHLLAAFAVSVSIDAPSLRLLLIFVVAFQAQYLCRRYVWLSHPESVGSIRWTESQWFVTQENGQETEVALTPSCRVFDQFVLLRLRSVDLQSKRQFFNLWLPGGGDSTDAIRRLRVQLNLTDSSQS
ncbi:MAG: hypothetical protein V7707_04665 [Motiliproteus sp.]